MTVSFGAGGVPALTLIVYFWSEKIPGPLPPDPQVYETVMKKLKEPA